MEGYNFTDANGRYYMVHSPLTGPQWRQIHSHNGLPPQYCASCQAGQARAATLSQNDHEQ